MTDEEKNDIRKVRPLVVGIAALLLKMAAAAGGSPTMADHALKSAEELFDAWEGKHLA